MHVRSDHVASTGRVNPRVCALLEMHGLYQFPTTWLT